MSEDTTFPTDFRSDDCATTDSFADHDIVDGVDLITETYYRLRDAGYEDFTPTGSWFDRIESAFIWAYLGSVDESGIPVHVELAIADARSLTEDEFVDRHDADLRTTVIPEFYQRVAGFHCIYREAETTVQQS